jgi:hypothetical protein
MDSGPVREFVARRAGIPAGALEVVTPRTPDQPPPPTQAENRKHSSDIVKPGAEYRLDIEANPTVPILDIYTQAPTARVAKRIADAAVEGARRYVAGLANTRTTPAGDVVRLEQLGPARGGVINAGVGVQLTLVSFLLVFGACAAAVLALSRIRQGWRAAERAEQPRVG